MPISQKYGVDLRKYIRKEINRKDILSLNLKGKGFWKNDIHSIENNRHAIRGYLEGDGFVSIRKHYSRGRPYFYRVLGAVFHPEQDYIRLWFKRFLDKNNIHYDEYKKVREPYITLNEIWIQRKKDSMMLYNILFKNATLFFKQKEISS